MINTAKRKTDRPWRTTLITLFPEMFPGPLGCSLSGQALADNIWLLRTVNLRDYGTGRHKAVDDTPAGGGPGMVLRADVVAAAIDAAREDEDDADLPLIYLSPRGEQLTQKIAQSLAEGPGVMLLAGRFEGIDERVIQGRNMREISIGDYILSGGEVAAMVLIDACVRLLPGVIGATESLAEESFAHDLLEYPHYTRPRDWEGYAIPNVLLSGDHRKIAQWRRDQAEAATIARRPDLKSPQPPKKSR